MNVLVLDPDSDAASELTAQMLDLGYVCKTVSKLQAAADLCHRGGVELLVCTEFSLIGECAALRADLPVVYASHQPFDVADLLSCVRDGARDCWQLPIDTSALKSQAELVVQRQRHIVRELNAEFQEMRVELERDQRAGQYIQLGMLPPNPMGIGHFRLQHKITPSLILSGDFIDYFQINQRYFACYVADVAGHGASSAFVTVLLKNFSRRLRREFKPSMLSNPGEVLAWINNELLDQQIDKHVAMFIGMVDLQNEKLAYSNAAHFPPAVLVNGEGELSSLEQQGKPLGLFPNAGFESVCVSFPKHARLVVFTDGVLDLVDAPTLEDKEAVLSDLIGQHDKLDALWASLDASTVGLDDVSCLMISHES